MAFLIFNRFIEKDGSEIFQMTEEKYRLAGYNLIYKAWEKRNRPLNQGWHVSAEELMQIHNDQYNYVNKRFLIDYIPSSKEGVGFIELLHVYAFTYGKEGDKIWVYWTPLMLKMRTIFEEYDPKIVEEKSTIVKSMKPPKDPRCFFEFLYLKGNDGGWGWGPTGRTNAAFLYDDARCYFRQFF